LYGGWREDQERTAAVTRIWVLWQFNGPDLPTHTEFFIDYGGDGDCRDVYVYPNVDVFGACASFNRINYRKIIFCNAASTPRNESQNPF
jgi:hypothetical protein